MGPQAGGEIGEGNIRFGVWGCGLFASLHRVSLFEKPFLHVWIGDKLNELLNAFRL